MGRGEKKEEVSAAVLWGTLKGDHLTAPEPRPAREIRLPSRGD